MAGTSADFAGRISIVPSREEAFFTNSLGSDLLGSDLLGSDLLGSDLLGSDLLGSDLLGSDLLGSDPTFVRRILQAIWPSRRCTPVEWIGFSAALCQGS